MFLSYEREAYYFKDDKQIRITFDTNIKYRTENVNLLPSISDIKLLPNNLVSMKLKVPFSIPYDFAKDLSSEKIFKTPFSKYGTAYKQIHNYHKIQSIKTTNLGSLIRIKYDIILKEDTSEKDFIDELRVKNGNLEIAICNTEINSEL